MKRVLIVDDESDIRESLQDFFEDKGYEVDAAANGAEALARLHGAELPCVIILDLLMPVLDGNQTYAAMQQEPRLAGLPVIISTSDPGRAPQGVLLMKKPINLQRLLSVVQQHCPD
jgi:CheY-like chemotaxis protein